MELPAKKKERAWQLENMAVMDRESEKETDLTNWETKNRISDGKDEARTRRLRKQAVEENKTKAAETREIRKEDSQEHQSKTY